MVFLHQHVKVWCFGCRLPPGGSVHQHQEERSPPAGLYPHLQLRWYGGPDGGLRKPGQRGHSHAGPRVTRQPVGGDGALQERHHRVAGWASSSPPVWLKKWSQAGLFFFSPPCFSLGSFRLLPFSRWRSLCGRLVPSRGRRPAWSLLHHSPLQRHAACESLLPQETGNASAGLFMWRLFSSRCDLVPPPGPRHRGPADQWPRSCRQDGVLRHDSRRDPHQPCSPADRSPGSRCRWVHGVKTKTVAGYCVVERRVFPSFTSRRPVCPVSRVISGWNRWRSLCLVFWVFSRSDAVKIEQDVWRGTISYPLKLFFTVSPHFMTQWNWR